jgi:lipoate-protein ligase A
MELQVHDAYANMAIDQAIMEGVGRGMSPPTIRFYRWRPSAVSIGYFQSLEEEVNLGRCREKGVDWVRRITGGGAVYHDYNGEVTYSVIAPEELFPRDIRESYRLICGWVITGLKSLGIESAFHPVNDILVEGRKISGNAQTRRNKVLLQHGTVLYDLNLRRMFTFLRVGGEKLSDKGIKKAEERVTCVKRYSDAGIEELYQALLEAFTEDKDWEFGCPREEELRRAKELVHQRYSTQEWNRWR